MGGSGRKCHGRANKASGKQKLGPSAKGKGEKKTIKAGKFADP